MMKRREECHCCKPGCPNTAVWELGAPVTANLLDMTRIEQIMDYTHSCDEEECREYLMEPYYKVRRLPEFETYDECMTARMQIN